MSQLAGADEEGKDGGRRRRKAIPATTTVPQSLVYPPRRPEAARRQAYPCQMRALPEDGKTKRLGRNARLAEMPAAHAAGRPDRSGSAMPVRRAPLIITTSRCPNSTSGTPSRAGGLAAGSTGIPSGRPGQARATRARTVPSGRPDGRPAGARGLVGLGRLERPTSRLSGVRSNQLSYRPESHPDAPHKPRAPRRATGPVQRLYEGTCRRRHGLEPPAMREHRRVNPA